VYSSEGFSQIRVDVTFAGDYNDFLWIEIRAGAAVLARGTAQGYFVPTAHIETGLIAKQDYEVRIWTDKCCTRYDGTVTRLQ
jgi:hypothetical protein